jgi:radical SAM superfamily enzyme YgiQ (UPF0313 family)
LYGAPQPPNAEPFAVETLAGALAKHRPDWHVSMLVVNPIIDPHAVQRLVTETTAGRYRLLGLSIPQGTLGLALEILSLIETALPPQNRPLVVLGHALPSHIPEVFLNRYPWVIAVRGWGEDAIVELTNFLANQELRREVVPGITYMRDGQVISTPIKHQILPQLPKRIQPRRYFPRVEASRGCQYGKCTFCTRPPGQHEHWCRLPTDAVLSSVRSLKDQGVRYFTFADEDFLGEDLHGALEISRGIREIGGMSFSLSLSAGNIYNPRGSTEENTERLRVMNELQSAGLTLAFIGVESLSGSQLVRYGKGIRPSDLVRAVDLVKGLDIDVEVGFMLFDPLVTIPELQTSLLALKTSGIWRYVNDFFRIMRVQKDTAYEFLMGRKELLKDLNPDSLDYDWDFIDDRVSLVKSEFYPLFRLLLNLRRTRRENPTAHRFLESFRHLDLLVFEHILAQGARARSEEPFPIVDKEFREHRRSLAGALQRALALEASTPEEEVLLDALDGFLSRPG